jgi:uncharacterized protein (TIGR03089 family)
VAKTANLLAHDLDAGPGSRVGVDLPVHWRSVVWVLATWCTGACVVTGPGLRTDGPLDVLVSSRTPGAPGSPPGTGSVDRGEPVPAGVLVAVALPGTASSFGVPLPPGTVDAAVETRIQPDVFVPVAVPDPDDPAVAGPTGDLPHARLLETAGLAARTAGAGTGDRVLTSRGLDAPDTDWLAALVGPLVLSGSVVLVDPTATGEGAPADPDHLVEVERVTLRM